MTNTMKPTNRPAAAQLCDIIVRKDAAIVALTKQLKIATEALEPFDRAAGKLDGLWDNNDWRWNDSVRSNVTVGDLRRAAQALARIKEVG